MTERTPEVEINVNSSEYADSVRIEIEILGADEAKRQQVEVELLQALKGVADRWVNR